MLGAKDIGALVVPQDLDWPKPVSDALARTFSTDVGHLAGSLLGRFDVGKLTERLLDRFTPGQLAVLRDRVLALRPLRQAQIADALGISRQRVSQIEKSVRKTLGSIGDAPETEPILWRAGMLKAALGAAAPSNAAVVKSEFARLTEQFGATIGSERIETPEFFLHVAGPYELDGEWLVRTDQGEALADIDKSLRGVSNRAGLVRGEVVEQLLGRHHIHVTFQEDWIHDRTSFRARPDRVYLDESGSLLERAERALVRLGRPASLVDLSAGNGDGLQPC